MSDVTAIVRAIEALRRSHGRVVVGISGFGGAGKSTLARALVSEITESTRLRGDDFLDPARSHRRSVDWDGVDRLRMRHQVIDPFRRGEPATYRAWDWSTGAPGEPRVLPDAGVLIVDAIGLFHPEMTECFDLAVWVDVDLPTAQRRGMHRDHLLGRDHDRLWNEVWVPNDRDFARVFAPMQAADLRYVPDDLR